MDRALQARLDQLVAAAHDRLEGRDHVADDIFRRHRGAGPANRHSGRIDASRPAHDVVDQQRVAGRPKRRGRHASGRSSVRRGRARGPMSEISMSSGEGSSRSSRRPDSMRCHARGGSPACLIMPASRLHRACGKVKSGPGGDGERQRDAVGLDGRAAIHGRLDPIDPQRWQDPDCPPRCPACRCCARLP